MNLKDRLDKIFDVSSYGYKVNKLIFRSAFALMVLLLTVAVAVDGFDVLVGAQVYYECPVGSGDCINPIDSMSCSSDSVGLLFDDLGDCSYNYVAEGWSYGVKPSLLSRYFSFICVGLFGFSLLLNHLLYNKNFRVKKHE